MRKKFLSYIYSFITKHPILIIIISLFLGALFFLAFRFIPLEADFINLLPQDSKPVKNLKFLTEKLKGVGQFSIVIESKKQDTEAMKKFSDQLNQELLSFSEIQFIQYKIPLDFILNNIFLFIETDDLEEIYKRVHEKVQYELWKDVPFFISFEDEEDKIEFNIDDIIKKYKTQRGPVTASETEYMISEDKKILVMFIKPDFMPTEVNKTGALIKKINKIINKINTNDFGKDLNISFAGTYTLSYDQKDAIYKDIRITSLIAFCFIFLAILFFIQRFDFSLFILYSLGIGVLSAFGVAYIAFQHINLITGFLIAILTGLGVNYGIHFLFRYREESKLIDKKKALKDAFILTGQASLTGALTTAVSFFTLSFSKFLGFSEFGILASSGIMITLISIYIVVTSLIILFNKLYKKEKTTPVEKKVNVLNNSNNILKFIIIGVSIILLTLTIIFIFNLRKIEFEYDSKKLEVKGQKSIITTELIQEKFNISTDPAIFYSYSREEEKDFYKKITEMMKKEESYIGNVLSLSGVLVNEEIQKERLIWVKKIKEELDSLPQKAIKDKEQKKYIEQIRKIAGSAKIISEDDLPENFSRRFFVNENNKKLYITQVFPKKVLFDAREMKKYVARIREIKGEKNTYYPTGMHVLYVFLIDTVLKESKIFISLVFFIIWILLLIDFKKIKDSLIAMIPIVLGTIWLIEIMSIFGIKFNFMNIIVLPTVLGTGVDNGVHILHRYRETKDIYKTIRKTGIANFGMSITVALGWSALFFAHYEGLKTMAFIGVVGIILTFIASVTIMPAVIILFEKRK